MAWMPKLGSRRTTKTAGGGGTPAAQSRSSFTFNGQRYLLQQTLAQSGPVERPYAFGDLAWIYSQNPVVYALVNLRARLFSEMTFKFRNLVDGHLFGGPELEDLETPWPGVGTGALLHRMLLDVDLAGNAYVVRNAAGGLDRLRPDWVSILIDSPSGDPNAADARVAGYVYAPMGQESGGAARTFLPEEVCHWAPVPSPYLRHLGESWIRSALADLFADCSATEHVGNYFRNGATVNLLVTLDADNPEDFAEGVAAFRDAHEGAPNAHGTLFLANGSTATPIGSDLKSVDFSATQGKAETRIAAAAGVPPTLAGLSEGLQATAYGSNFDAARRGLADTLLRPLYRSACAALATLVDVPAGAELWYDESLIPFLRAELTAAATTRQTDAATVASLITAGFTPESAVAAVQTDDFSALQHTGRVSVQLVDPGATPAADPATNGSQDGS